MGVPVLILGASGSGKSTSLRNFKPADVAVLNVAGKPLPFKGQLPKIDNCGYETIKNALKRANKNCYIVDDSQYLLSFDSFAKATEKGYDKWTDMAVNFYQVIKTAISETPPDCVVYFLHHTEMNELGKTKAKTLGKMLDNQLTVEGLFSIVLLTETDGNDHWFITQSDGTTPCKSPMGMFEDLRMGNDLAMVDSKIREYWGLSPIDKVAKPAEKPKAEPAKEQTDVKA